MHLPRSSHHWRMLRAGVPVALVGWLALGSGPPPLSAQGVDSRTPNLTDGWVSGPGTLQFNFNHRFWTVPSEAGRTVNNTPTFLLAAPLPGRLLVGLRYASNSRVADRAVNEWEVFGRWAPVSDGPADLALTGAYNGAVESVDGELSLRIPLELGEGPGSIDLIGSVRGFSNAVDLDVSGWFVGGGVVVHVTENVGLSVDAGQLSVDGQEPDAAWGAGIHLRIPASPHTLNIYGANTQTSTLQGSSFGFRRNRPVWGFEFTVPISLDRYL